MRARMSSIMGQIEPEHRELFALNLEKLLNQTVYTVASDLIGPELSELSALELENLPYLTVYTLASANIDLSVPNLATIYLPIK